MNSKNLLYFILIVLGGLFIMSCEGPMGPAGPAGQDGVDGVDGVDGTDGTDGVDGTTVCIQCHSLAHKNTVTAQYETSGHAAGNYVGYAGGRKSCARCHSHEGFVETQFTGQDTTAANVPIPTAIGCATCHDSHNTFDFATDGQDYALRTATPIELIGWPDEATVDMGNSSNLCGKCHQPRRPAPEADGDGNFKITSTHYGPHHGPQVTVLYGLGGYEFDGILTYPEDGSAAHYKDATCVACHMHEADHSFWPSQDACTACHTNGAPDIAAEIHGLLDQLAAILEAEGVLDADHHVVPGTYPVELAGAFYNWIMIEEDRSVGVHNPRYARALLTNSIAAVQ